MKRFITYIFLGLFLLGCARMEQEHACDKGAEVYIKAFPGDISTKTERQENAIYWCPGDAVSLFFNQGQNGGNRFVAQNEAVSQITDFKGTITGFAGGGESTGGEFWFWGVYPYSEENSCDGSSVTLVLPEKQIAKAGTFNNNLFPTIAKSKGLELGFYNICGGFKFSVSRNDIVAVKFFGNSNESLAGKARIGWDTDVPPHPIVIEHLEGKAEITVSAPNGETFESGKDYYIVLFPELLSNGFTITFYTANNKEGSFIYNQSRQIKRGIFISAVDLDQKVPNWSDIDSPFIDTSVEGGSESGLYLGITYFGSNLSIYPARLLTEESVNDFNIFIDSRSELDDETLLYYAVDKAMLRLQSNRFPDDLFSASIVTFTDGQDDGSIGWKEDETGKTYYKGDYEKEIEKILDGTVQGIPVMSYSIGLKQSGTSSNTAFTNSLKTIAHPATNYTLATNMTDVNDTFGHIAQELSNTIKLNKLIGTIPRQATGTKIRFTYDNITSASNSTLYIEGIYYSSDYSLRNVIYAGMTSTSGETVIGIRKSNKVTFTFEGIHRPNNTDINMTYFKRWIYNSDTLEWEEYKETSYQEGENGITREIKSAAIILNLDCTKSLGETNFSLLKKYAKNFINTLYNSSIDPEAVKNITLNTSSIELPVGGSIKLTATISPSTAIEKGIIWSSSNPEVASVDGNGNVQANAVGNAIITATSKDGGKKASCSINVFQAVTSIDLNKTSLSLKVGEQFTLVAAINPDNAKEKEVTWSTSDATIAAVSNGIVAAKKVGSAIITAKAGDKTSTCNITVEPKQITSISLNKTSVSLKEGETVELTAIINPEDATDKTITWSTSDATIATVSNGIVMAKKVGSAVITAKAGSKSATCTVSVDATDVTSISINHQTMNIQVGSNAQLAVTILPTNATDKSIEWTSSDESVATISSNGVVCGVTYGTATIYAKSINNPLCSASCTVSVVPTTIPSSLDLAVEEKNTGTRYYIPQNLYNEGHLNDFTILGVVCGDYGSFFILGMTDSYKATYVGKSGNKFIYNYEYELTGSEANSLTTLALPDATMAQWLSKNMVNVNSALKVYGGTAMLTNANYWTSSYQIINARSGEKRYRYFASGTALQIDSDGSMKCRCRGITSL